MPPKIALRAGKISKPYGLSGSVHLLLEPGASEIIENGNPLFIEIDGQRVPFFVEDYDPVSDDQAIAKFEFIDTVEEARNVSGCDIYLERSRPLPADGPSDEFSSLIGYEAFDLRAGYFGTITAYDRRDMNPLFLVTGKGKEIMVPAVEEMIIEINHRKRIIRFDLPEGLPGM
jgi:16S rRNA processing protein RimM